MPQLSNPRHEAFAQARANGVRQYEAYIAAGFEGNATAASQMAKRPEITARIAELAAERVAIVRETEGETDESVSEIDKQWIMKELKKNVQKAQGDNQIAAANKAIELLMDIVGLTKKSKAPGPAESQNGPVKDSGVPSDEKLGKALDALADLAAGNVVNDAGDE